VFLLLLLFFFFFVLRRPHCEGCCGAALSALPSWAAPGLLLHGALLPSAGEPLKSSSSSRPLAASYCVFSRRVIRRSSSSPNSPPIRVGSPTTITSWRGGRDNGSTATDAPDLQRSRCGPTVSCCGCCDTYNVVI